MNKEKEQLKNDIEKSLPINAQIPTHIQMRPVVSIFGKVNLNCGKKIKKFLSKFRKNVS